MYVLLQVSKEVRSKVKDEVSSGIIADSVSLGATLRVYKGGGR
jgi:hypothetical protein